jgi:23S rRNA (adenine-N6)-dimethyltransferase
MTPRSRSTLWRSQNFLRRPELVDRLLDRSGIGPADVVYDLGAGAGALTEGLAARCRRVVAVEADPRLCAELRRRFGDRPRVEVRCADVLDLPLPRRPYKVFASPPFDATAAVVTRLLGAPVPPADAFLVVQREAAERFIGAPSETLYALLLKPWFAPSVEHRFRRGDFDPAPAVDVVLMRLRKRGPPLVAHGEARLYRDFVTACFTAWRPTVGEALTHVVGSRVARDAVRRAGVDATRRPSATPFAAWLRLFGAFAALADAPARRAVAGAELGLRRRQAGLRKRHRTAVAARPPRPRVARAVRPGETSETRGPPGAMAVRQPVVGGMSGWIAAGASAGSAIRAGSRPGVGAAPAPS